MYIYIYKYLPLSDYILFPGFCDNKQRRSPLGPNLLRMGASLCCYISLNVYIVLASGPLAASWNLNLGSFVAELQLLDIWR